MAQLVSEPDPEDGYLGRPIKHERPHLVPLGYVLLFTPLLLLFELINSFIGLTYAVPFITMWIPFALMGGLWSLALYVRWRRTAANSKDGAPPHS